VRWSTAAHCRYVQASVAFTSLFLDRPIITVIWHDVSIVPRLRSLLGKAMPVHRLRGQESEVVVKRCGEGAKVEGSC
jgi:hypothetical protein